MSRYDTMLTLPSPGVRLLVALLLTGAFAVARKTCPRGGNCKTREVPIYLLRVDRPEAQRNTH
jgi:hypothetical protein